MRFCFYINREIRLTLQQPTTDDSLSKIWVVDVGMCVWERRCMLTVTCCAAQDKVQFKQQLSGSLWKSLCYPAPMVSAVAVKPCCAEFITHAHERTDKHTCRLGLNNPKPQIRPIPCHISADTLPLWLLVAHNFFHLYRVIIFAPLHTPANPPVFASCQPPCSFTVSYFTGAFRSSMHKAGSHWLKWAQAVPSGEVQPPYTPGAWRSGVRKGPIPCRYQPFTRPLMRACWLGKVRADVLLWSGAVLLELCLLYK